MGAALRDYRGTGSRAPFGARDADSARAQLRSRPGRNAGPARGRTRCSPSATPSSAARMTGPARNRLARRLPRNDGRQLLLPAATVGHGRVRVLRERSGAAIGSARGVDLQSSWRVADDCGTFVADRGGRASAE
jgi:hypothetical protein